MSAAVALTTRTEKFVLEWLAENPLEHTALRYPRPPWSIGTKSRRIGGAANRLAERLRKKRWVDNTYRITPAGRAALEQKP